MEYGASSVYTDKAAGEIESSPQIADKQEKQTIMDTYDSFMDIMNIMVLIFVMAAVVLGIVVLYNLGVMSYVERSRELATLKVLGFRDRHIGKLLITFGVSLAVSFMVARKNKKIDMVEALKSTE